MYQFGAKSLSRMAGVDSRLIEIAQRAIKITHVDFGIPRFGGVRTETEQFALFIQDKSKADGRNDISKHQLGLALDVYAYVDGRANWDAQNLLEVAAAMLQAANELGYKLRWGGAWASWRDMPHFEIED